jgi:hypothetical protein
MRSAFAAGLAAAAILAGCGAAEDPSGGGSGNSGPLWVQTDIAGADLDGDGQADVVTLAMLQQNFGVSDGYLKIYRQTAPGSFTSTQIQIGRYPWRLKIADVNGDGAPDLLVLDVVGGSGANDDVLYLLLQDPNNRGSFQAARTVASGLSANDFVVTDADLDLAPDIVTAGIPGGGTGAAQYLQRPTDRGTFDEPTTLGLQGRVARLAAGDFGGSGRADLVAYSVLDTSPTASNPGQLVVAYSTLFAGAGSSTFFAVPGTVLASYVGLLPQAIEVTDVDENGLADIVLCLTPSAAEFEGRIATVLQRTLGRVEVVETSIAHLSGVDGFVVADLNNDGRADVATTGFYPVGSPSTVRSRTNLLMSQVGGRFVTTAQIDMPVSMSRIAAIDVDGDGLNDLLLLGASNRAYVMLQSAASPGTFAAPRLL